MEAANIEELPNASGVNETDADSVALNEPVSVSHATALPTIVIWIADHPNEIRVFTRRQTVMFPVLKHLPILPIVKTIIHHPSKRRVTMICSLTSKVEGTRLQTINDLEKDLGKTLLAFSCHDLKASALSVDELKKIQDVENKLGVSLVAVEA